MPITESGPDGTVAPPNTVFSAAPNLPTTAASSTDEGSTLPQDTSTMAVTAVSAGSLDSFTALTNALTPSQRHALTSTMVTNADGSPSIPPPTASDPAAAAATADMRVPLRPADRTGQPRRRRKPFAKGSGGGAAAGDRAAAGVGGSRRVGDGDAAGVRPPLTPPPPSAHPTHAADVVSDEEETAVLSCANSNTRQLRQLLQHGASPPTMAGGAPPAAVAASPGPATATVTAGGSAAVHTVLLPPLPLHSTSGTPSSPSTVSRSSPPGHVMQSAQMHHWNGAGGRPALGHHSLSSAPTPPTPPATAPLLSPATFTATCVVPASNAGTGAEGGSVTTGSLPSETPFPVFPSGSVTSWAVRHQLSPSLAGYVSCCTSTTITTPVPSTAPMPPTTTTPTTTSLSEPTSAAREVDICATGTSLSHSMIPRPERGVADWSSSSLARGEPMWTAPRFEATVPASSGHWQRRFTVSTVHRAGPRSSHPSQQLGRGRHASTTAASVQDHLWYSQASLPAGERSVVSYVFSSAASEDLLLTLARGMALGGVDLLHRATSPYPPLWGAGHTASGPHRSSGFYGAMERAPSSVTLTSQLLASPSFEALSECGASTAHAHCAGGVAPGMPASIAAARSSHSHTHLAWCDGHGPFFFAAADTAPVDPGTDYGLHAPHSPPRLHHQMPTAMRDDVTAQPHTSLRGEHWHGMSSEALQQGGAPLSMPPTGEHRGEEEAGTREPSLFAQGRQATETPRRRASTLASPGTDVAWEASFITTAASASASPETTAHPPGAPISAHGTVEGDFMIEAQPRPSEVGHHWYHAPPTSTEALPGSLGLPSFFGAPRSPGSAVWQQSLREQRHSTLMSLVSVPNHSSCDAFGGGASLATDAHWGNSGVQGASRASFVFAAAAAAAMSRTSEGFLAPGVPPQRFAQGESEEERPFFTSVAQFGPPPPWYPPPPATSSIIPSMQGESAAETRHGSVPPAIAFPPLVLESLASEEALHVATTTIGVRPHHPSHHHHQLLPSQQAEASAHLPSEARAYVAQAEDTERPSRGVLVMLRPRSPPPFPTLCQEAASVHDSTPGVVPVVTEDDSGDGYVGVSGRAITGCVTSEAGVESFLCANDPSLVEAAAAAASMCEGNASQPIEGAGQASTQAHCQSDLRRRWSASSAVAMYASHARGLASSVTWLSSTASNAVSPQPTCGGGGGGVSALLRQPISPLPLPLPPQTHQQEAWEEVEAEVPPAAIVAAASSSSSLPSSRFSATVSASGSVTVGIPTLGLRTFHDCAPPLPPLGGTESGLDRSAYGLTARRLSSPSPAGGDPGIHPVLRHSSAQFESPPLGSHRPSLWSVQWNSLTPRGGTSPGNINRLPTTLLSQSLMRSSLVSALRSPHCTGAGVPSPASGLPSGSQQTQPAAHNPTSSPRTVIPRFRRPIDVEALLEEAEQRLAAAPTFIVHVLDYHEGAVAFPTSRSSFPEGSASEEGNGTGLRQPQLGESTLSTITAFGESIASSENSPKEAGSPPTV